MHGKNGGDVAVMSSHRRPLQAFRRAMGLVTGARAPTPSPTLALALSEPVPITDWCRLGTKRSDFEHDPAGDVLPPICRVEDGCRWQGAWYPSSLLIAGWKEHRAGSGEDAAPSFLFSPSANRGLLGVYDGLGGAGAAKMNGSVDGARSEAWLAARLARATVERWWMDGLTGSDRDQLADALRRELTATFQSVARDRPSTSKLRGTLRRRLPTTIALLAFRGVRSGAYEVDALWAGDSRCYLLTTAGLQQLTLDDTEVPDVLAQLLMDPPITNVVCADQSFAINHRSYEINGPAVLLTATDGCFGYVATPAHFEHHLLTALDEADSLQEWVSHTLAVLVDNAQDDVSFAALSLGFSDFRHIRQHFRQRTEEVRGRYWMPFMEAHAKGDMHIRELCRASWDMYCETYLARIRPAIPEEG